MDWTKSEGREFHKNALRMKKEYLKLFMREWLQTRLKLWERVMVLEKEK